MRRESDAGNADIQRHEVLHEGAVVTERYNPAKPHVLSGDAYFLRKFPTPSGLAALWLHTCQVPGLASPHNRGHLYVGDKCSATSFQIHKVGYDYKTPIMHGDTVLLKANETVPHQDHFWAFLGVDNADEPTLHPANAANPLRLLEMPQEHVWTIWTEREEGDRNIRVEDKIRLVKTCQAEVCPNDCLAVEASPEDAPSAAQSACRSVSEVTLLGKNPYPDLDQTMWELKDARHASCSGGSGSL
jgi:hypothetical protein